MAGRGEEENETPCSSFNNTWLRCAEETTINGLLHAVRYQNPLRKLLWFSLFVSGMTLTTLSVWGIASDYLSYPIVTTVSVSPEPSLEFPAVTVCNSSPVDCYRLAKFRSEYPRLWRLSGCRVRLDRGLLDWVRKRPNADLGLLRQALLSFRAEKEKEGTLNEVFYQIGIRNESYFLPKSSSSLWDLVQGDLGLIDALFSLLSGEFLSGNLTVLLSLGSPGPTATEKFKDLLPPPPFFPFPEAGKEKRWTQLENLLTSEPRHLDLPGMFENWSVEASSEFNQKRDFMVEFLGIPEKIQELVVHRWNHLIIDCSFKGQNCYSEKNFLQFRASYLGACYAFNSAFNQHDPLAGKRRATVAGDDEIVRLPSPYRDECIGSWNETDFLPFYRGNRRPNNVTPDYDLVVRFVWSFHSVVLGTDEIVSDEVSMSFSNATGCAHRKQAICNITHLGIPFSNLQIFLSLFLSGEGGTSYGMGICADEEGERCEGGSDQQDMSICHCHASCLSKSYRITTSIATWPSTKYMRRYARKVMERHLTTDLPDLPPPSSPLSGLLTEVVRQRIREEFLRLDVSFQTLDLHSVAQHPRYDFKSLVSTIGGAMGVYLGLSIVNCVEILESLFFLLFALRSLCPKWKRAIVSPGDGKRL
ncbi:unnamed protein product [Darwinula stevensoni]|uniref:Uncharacterized protein n=1 Tax=Darwinula stevensoni TaxID=69355 RepID=A0A7R8X8B6_9CRUS|nr:unnamed protein product [Darwinula stevensoni]CAG0889937.1 unnamed protein product [Darwinula stevensoni]